MKSLFHRKDASKPDAAPPLPTEEDTTMERMKAMLVERYGDDEDGEDESAEEDIVYGIAVGFVEGKELVGAADGESQDKKSRPHTYCTARISENSRSGVKPMRTGSGEGTSPVWHNVLAFDSCTDETSVELSCWLKGRFKDKLLGTCSVHCQDLKMDESSDAWHTLHMVRALRLACACLLLGLPVRVLRVEANAWVVHKYV